jgi:hypothetical protein
MKASYGAEGYIPHLAYSENLRFLGVARRLTALLPPWRRAKRESMVNMILGVV